MSEQPPTVIVQTDPAQSMNAPSIALIVVASVGLVLQAIWLLLKILGTGLTAMIPDHSAESRWFTMFYGGLGITTTLVGMLVAVFLIYAATKMRKLESWGLGMAASIVVMIPCISPCCLLGIPVGIWCLVVLSDQRIKSAFH